MNPFSADVYRMIDDLHRAVEALPRRPWWALRIGDDDTIFVGGEFGRLGSETSDVLAVWDVPAWTALSGLPERNRHDR